MTSRAAENLFWMGRYAERAEQRVPAGVLGAGMAGGAPDRQRRQRRPPAAAGKPMPLYGAVAGGHAGRHRAGSAWRALRIGLVDGQDRLERRPRPERAGRRRRASARPAVIHVHGWCWPPAGGSGQQAARPPGDYSNAEALADLGQLAVELVAIAGEQADHMTRDDGWRFWRLAAIWSG